MKVERHREFLLCGVRIKDAVLHRSGRHFTNRHKIIRPKYALMHLFHILMYPWTIGIEPASVTGKDRSIIIREILIFRDEVNDIHPEPANPLLSPEGHQLHNFFPDLGILPVQIGLCLIE
ncbi:hypothetical protein D3C85_1190760 [compost metagenome]